MLIKGDIDAALVFNITSYFNLVLNRQDPDKDFKWFSFGDYGLDLYSNGVIVSRKLLASNPKAVAGLVRAVNKGVIAVAKDQNAGMKATVNYDNLINAEVEKRRRRHHFGLGGRKVALRRPPLHYPGAGECSRPCPSGALVVWCVGSAA